jgi:tetratricopeptide (TPR) repeat protein
MLAYAERSAEVCRTWRLYGWEPMMTYTTAWAQMILGRLKQSEETARTTLANAQRHNNVGAQGWTYLVLAFLAVQTARWEQASGFADQADAIAVMLHDVDLRARALWSRSVCAGWRGDWAEAIRAINEALQTARQVDEAFMMQPYLLLQAAKAYFYAGKLEEADTYLEQAMRLAQERQYRQLPAMGMRLLGRILVAQGKFEAALPCFEQSLADLAALDDALEHTRTVEAYGLFYLARNRPGDSMRGKEMLDTARATFKRLGVTG